MSYLLPYLAGLFDGEGCLAEHSDGKRKRLTLEVKMTDEALVRLFETEFGGHVYHRGYDNPKWKPTWRWRVTDGKARAAYDRLEPFLRLKRLSDQNPIK